MMSVARVVRQSSMESQQCFELGISRSCCRNLFGPIDHAQLRAELDSELKRIADEKKRRWNFDFVKAEPLDGDFLWQRIGDERLSVGHSTNEELSTTSSRTSDRITPRHTSGATTHAESNATSRTSSAQKSCFATPERLSAKCLRKSPRITDYLRAKKSPSTSRRIKFSSQAGVPKICRRVQTRKTNGRCRPIKQSTLDQFMSKLRPRHPNGKVQVSN